MRAIPFLLPAVVCVACAHLPVDVVVNPTPTPSPTSTPQGCSQTVAPNTTILIGMASSITPSTDPTYGTINGYGVTDATLFAPAIATTVTARTTDVIQFVNLELGAAINHSAVGFPNATAFPTPPVTFSPAVQSPIGTQISQQQWSTGIIAAAGTFGACFSQPFTIAAPGTYYFGDYNYYNLSNTRDVLIVTH